MTKAEDNLGPSPDPSARLGLRLWSAAHTARALSQWSSFVSPEVHKLEYTELHKQYVKLFEDSARILGRHGKFGERLSVMQVMLAATSVVKCHAAHSLAIDRIAQSAAASPALPLLGSSPEVARRLGTVPEIVFGRRTRLGNGSESWAVEVDQLGR